MEVVPSPGAPKPAGSREALGPNSRSAPQREDVIDQLKFELLPQKGVFSSWGPHFSLLQRDCASGWGHMMPYLDEKGLFQEDSPSGTHDPSHKGDSFSKFQGFTAIYVKVHGWREACTLSLPCSSFGATGNTQRY